MNSFADGCTWSFPETIDWRRRATRAWHKSKTTVSVAQGGPLFPREDPVSLRRARGQPNVVFESGHFATTLAMVAAGSGVSVVPQMAVEERAGCRFIPPSDDRAYRRVGILQLKHHFRSRVHRAFLEHLHEVQKR